MSGVVPLLPRLRFSDPSGNPVAGGSLTVYLAGTTTPAPTFQDAALTIPNTNPQVLDGNGEAMVWMPPGPQYKFLVKDALGATVPGWPLDNVPGAPGSGGLGGMWFIQAGDGIHDDTARVQAVFDTAPAGSIIQIGPGPLLLSAVTINKALIVRGSGMAQTATLIRSTSATLDTISITTASQVELSDFCMDATVPRTAGQFIALGTNAVANGASLIRRLELISPYLGINVISAAQFTIENCYIATPVSVGIKVTDIASADSGDSTITNCTIDLGAHDTRVAISQSSGGGLRIINNKFLGGAFHILAQLSAQTSILLVTGNSSEGAGTANMALSGVNPTTFSKVVVTGNQFSIDPAANGISVTDPGYAFLDDLTIGGNTFNLAAASGGINLGRGGRVSILPNSFIGNGAACVGITFGANVGAYVHPQNMPSVTTRYSGTFTGVTFVPGGLVQSGSNVDTTTAAYGTLFNAPARAIVFPIAYPKPPIVTIRIINGPGAGVGAPFSVAPSTTGFSYAMLAITNGAAVTVAWEASGG